jgi:succinate dehydrogenase / fumarate reductase iron-sulfur subunit
MIINGIERLACKTLVKDITEKDGDTVTIEPLKSMPVQRDLYIDQEGFFEKYRIVQPYLIPKEKAPEKEYIQSQEERDNFEDSTKCILCSACYSSCPVIEDGIKDFIGPAASAQAARFAFDTRDVGIAGRIDLLDKPDGIWACDNRFNCTKVCPRGIKITKNINQLKKLIKKDK